MAVEGSAGFGDHEIQFDFLFLADVFIVNDGDDFTFFVFGQFLNLLKLFDAFKHFVGIGIRVQSEEV